MKKILCLLFILPFIVCAQEEESKKTFLAVKTLAPFLVKNKTGQEEKLKAIYSWVTNNIAYDTKMIESDKPFQNVSGDKILKSKKTICFGYCDLLQELLMEVGIASEVINGYVQSSYPDSTKIPSVDTHSWISVKINGEWILLDPTWDAGYVGPLATDKKEKFQKKWDKLDAKNSKIETKIKLLNAKQNDVKAQKKVKSLEAKIEKTKEKLATAESKSPDYKDEVGFVQFPAEKYFMISADSFMVNHLPVNPLWQLTKDTMSVQDFSKLSEKRKNSKVTSVSNQGIGKYLGLDYLQKMIWSADDAYRFNPKNYQVKALNYYNYLGTITNKKNKNKLPNKYKNPLKSDMLSKIDTASVYAKIGKKESKSEYSLDKKTYSSIYKNDVKSQKSIKKYVESFVKKNEKTIELSKTRVEKMHKELVSLKSKINKLSGYKRNEKPSVKRVESIKFIDSLDKLVGEFDQLKKSWEQSTNDRILQSLIDTIQGGLYYLKVKNANIEQKDYMSNGNEKELDSLIMSNMEVIENLYNDSLPIELMSKKIMKQLSSISLFITNAGNEMSLLETKDDYTEKTAMTNYMKAVLKSKYEELEVMNKKGIQHNLWVGEILKSFETPLDNCLNVTEKQLDLIESRNEYVQNKLEKSYLRSKNLFEEITDACKKWKPLYK
jgi:hypothetical protein